MFRGDDGPVRPPGPDGWPVVGVFFDYVREPFEFATRVARDYGPLAYYPSLFTDFYQVNDPDLVEEVLVHQNQKFIKGSLFQQTLRPVVGDGLLTAEGEQWRRQRHMVNPAFHPDRIREYADVMVGDTRAMLDDWHDGETLDVHEAMMELTLDIVAKTLFGVDVGDRAEGVGEAMGIVMMRAESPLSGIIPLSVPTPSNRRFERAVETIAGLVDDIVDERRANPGDDVLSALLAARDEDGEAMSDELVRDEVRTLLLAGHETTALALTFTLFVLAQHPDVEERLLAELDEVLDGRPATRADADDLVYTERIVKESMRLYPPVHGILREAAEEVEIGGYTIPEGATISLNQWTLHRDSRFYADPMAFQPDRWTDEFEQSLPRFAYFPFAGGPRRCIGDRFAMLEATLVLATLYQGAHFELVSEPKLSLAASITSRPTEPVVMRVHKREDGAERSPAGEEEAEATNTTNTTNTTNDHERSELESAAGSGE
jgi:cytochrome P450